MADLGDFDRRRFATRVDMVAVMSLSRSQGYVTRGVLRTFVGPEPYLDSEMVAELHSPVRVLRPALHVRQAQVRRVGDVIYGKSAQRRQRSGSGDAQWLESTTQRVGHIHRSATTRERLIKVAGNDCWAINACEHVFQRIEVV